MSPEGSKVVVVPVSAGKPVVVPIGRMEPVSADWVNNREIVLFRGSHGEALESFIVGLDGKNLRPLRRDSVTAATRDSSVLLFESVRGGLSAIFAMDRRRLTVRQLTRGFWAEQATLSPDGRTILFEKRVDPNNMLASDVVTMGLDGSGQTVIAAGTDPSWSPDGSLVLFKTPDAANQLWIATLEHATKTLRRLARGVHPQWSPNGRQIVYMRAEPGDNDVYVMNRDGSQARCLTCARR